jgi:hypothetical protein
MEMGMLGNMEPMMLANMIILANSQHNIFFNAVWFRGAA